MKNHRHTTGLGVRFTREDDEVVIRTLIAKRKIQKRLDEAQIVEEPK
jgi:hypothetical protein